MINKQATKAHFDFHSSGSAESDTDQNHSVLKQRHQKQSASTKKVPLNVTSVKKTAQNRKSLLPNSTGKLPDNRSVDPQTPVYNGKRFFKTRTPGSADRSFGRMVIQKGFDIKFIAKRGTSKSLTPKLDKKTGNTFKSASKTKSVEKVKASEAHPFMKYSPLKTDGTEAGEEVDNPAQDKENITVLSKQAADKADSGVDTANSADMISSHEIDTGINNSISTDSEQDVGNIFEDDDDGSISLISTNFYNEDCMAGSEDLFSTPGSIMKNNSEDNRSDVDQMSDTGLNTESPSMSEITPVYSKTNSPAKKLSGNSKSSPRLFPIFMKAASASQNSSQSNNLRASTSPGSSRSSPGSGVNTPLLRYVRSKDTMEQMTIDAGQVRRYGATQCEVCGMVYTQSEPADETMHLKFHQSLLNVLKFPGWKKERTVQEYLETGSRVIVVKAEDPKYAKKKVEDILKVMGQELGYAEASMGFKEDHMAFLYISDNRKVEGCCVCQPIQEGYRVIVESQASSGSHQSAQRPWYCSETPERAMLGVSRIWVHSQARRKGIATKLLDCVRQWSMYGTQIPKSMLAFSDPTNDGKVLATKYTGTSKFLVYKYQ
ncbi:N-acetyltransferase ESCO2-like isoform X2 [Dreissena polymorpha]|nr:N-acetyltransferase ESCO2-like isoform X2 [Dreissena polymorpha]